MGFRKDSFATVWEVSQVSNSRAKGRISISRKDKDTGEYVQDFGGFVMFCGTACANKALNLKPKDRIKLGDVDVSNRYDKEKNVTYTNFNVFDFEMADGSGSTHSRGAERAVDDGDIDDGELPF